MNISTPSDTDSTATRVHSGTILCVCPHWDPGKRACLLNKEGLFLPVNEHVKAYCLSNRYSACHYFLQPTSPEVSVEGVLSAVLNRRRFIRIPSRHVFRFSEITGNDELPGRSQDDAWTVDLGTSGLRFVSRVALPVQTKVRFCLEGDAATANMVGTGRVAWSEPLANTALFHTGLAFVDSSIVKPSGKAEQ